MEIASITSSRLGRLWKKGQSQQFTRDLGLGPLWVFLSQARPVQLTAKHAHLVSESDLPLSRHRAMQFELHRLRFGGCVCNGHGKMVARTSLQGLACYPPPIFRTRCLLKSIHTFDENSM